MNYEYSEYEAKVHLKYPFVLTLKKWRKMIVVAVIFALLFSAYTFVSTKLNVNSSGTEEIRTSIQEKEETLAELSEGIIEKEENVLIWTDTKDQLNLRLYEASRLDIGNGEALSNIIKLKEAISDISRDIEDVTREISRDEDQILDLQEEIPEMQDLLKSRTTVSLKGLILRAIAGAIVGMILFFIAIFLKTIFDGRFHCREDFEDGMKLRILGWLYEPVAVKKQNFIDKYVFKMETSGEVKDTFEMIAARLETGMAEDSEKEFILTGPVEMSVLEEVKEKLCNIVKTDIKMKIAENPVYVPEDLYEICNKNVIIVASNNETKITEINKLVDSLSHSKAQITGCIIF